MDERNDRGPNHATTPSLVDSDDRIGADTHWAAGSWTVSDDAAPTVSAGDVFNVRMDLIGLAAYLKNKTARYSSITHKPVTAVQVVQNALARTITRSPRSVPKSQLLYNLHWLPIHKRINFKVAALTYKVLTTQQPAYLHNLFIPSTQSFSPFL